jgi:flagellar protein FliL
MANPEPTEAEAPTETKPASAKSGVLKWVIVGVGAFVAVTLSLAIAPIITQRLSTGLAAHAAAKPADGEGDTTADGDTEEPAEPLTEPMYTPLNPPMVVNFANDPDGFMQVEVQVMARDKSVIDAVKANEPAIRNALLMLYGGKTRDDVTNREGKEKLRAETLEEVKRVVAPYTGDAEVEDVYFTSLIAQ